ncbi:hypothetical protein HDV00_001828 [Rhizophlyctis rosea]|nr:hypothetical protein HDV00_001828 [Rhizophlyctis rosea]
MNIPWNDLKNKPVKILINNVYLLAAPRGETDYDPVEEEESAQKVKREKLETAEMLATRPKSQQGDTEAQNATFVTQLVTKIVDNLQVKMKNIHIRYEDKLSNPAKPFSVGITLGELSAVSTDENWNEKFIHDEVGVIYKLLRLGSLAVYWNTDAVSLAGKPPNDSRDAFMGLIASGEKLPPELQYILKPVSGEGKLKSNKSYRPGEPRTSATLQFDELGFVLDDEQYSSLFALLGAFSFYVRNQPYRKYRPPRSITPKLDPQAWLKYAGTCVLTEIHDKHRRWTWAYFAERRDDRRQYIKLYEELKRGTLLAPEDREALDDLERKLSFEDIHLYRSLANAQLKKERVLREKTVKKTQPPPSQQTWTGWAASFIYTPQAQDTTQDQTTLSDEEVKQLYDTIEYDPKTALEVTDFPDEAVLLDAQCQLNTGSITLKQEPTGKAQVLMSLVFEEFTAQFQQHPHTMKGKLSLGGMTLNDGTTANTLYPTLIRAKNKKDDSASISELQAPFLQLEFEQNPLDKRADNALTIKMLPLEVIYNPTTIKSMLAFLTPPASESATVSTIQAMAVDTLSGLTAQTRAGLEYALEEHKTLDLRLDLDAPIFIIPESCTDASSMVAVVDAGHLVVNSNLVDSEKKKELQQKQGAKLTEKEIGYLKSLLYDKFTCELNSVQVLLGPSINRCMQLISKDSLASELHVIERVNLSFCIEMCILPKLPDYPRTKISGELPRLHLNLSDTKYKTTMRLIDIVMDSLFGGKEQGSDQAVVVEPLDWRFLTGGDNVVALNNGEESDSEKEGADDDDDSFFDASENLGVAAKKVTFEDPKKVTVELRFDIHQASVSLKKADRHDATVETSLAELTVSGFGLDVKTRPFDMDVGIQIRSIQLEDLLQKQSEFTYLLTPTLKDREGTPEGPLDDGQLVQVQYHSIKHNHPDYDGIDSSVDVSLAAVTVVLTKGTVLSLYDFILMTFTAAGDPAHSRTGSQTSIVKVTSEETGQTTEEEVPDVSPPSYPTTMLVRASMKSINFIVNQDGRQLATATFGALKTSVLLKESTMKVTGSIGDLSIVDDVARVEHNRLYRQLLRIDGEEVAHFTWETYNQSDEGYPGYDSALTLKANSMRLTYLERLIKELMEYLSEFQRMHLLLEAARKAAVESAAQIQETAGKFHFDIHIDTPILEFPHASLQLKDMVTMYPGSISAKNVFETDTGSGGLVNKIVADVTAMKAVSSFFVGEKVRERQIIKDVNVHVLYTSQDSGGVEGVPESAVDVKASDVRLTLTPKQYKFLLDLFNQLFGGPGPAPQKEIEDQSADRSQSEKDQPAPDVADGSRVSMDARVHIPSICFEILQPSTGSGDEEESLAMFSVHDLIVKAAMHKDSAMEVEVQVQAFSIKDTRPSSGNLFQEIMPASTRKEEQLVLRLSRTNTGRSVYIVTVDSPQLFLVLDHLFLVRDYFVAPLSLSSDASGPVRQEGTQPANVGDEPQEPMTFRVTLANVEIILLQDACLASTEAVILMAKQLVVAQELVLSIGVQDMGMFFCSMDNREETSLRFIQNFDLTMSMDDRMTGPGHKLTNILLDLSPLMLRISYRDVQLLMEILNQYTELSTRSNAAPISAAAAGVENALTSSKSLPDIVMARERLQVSIKSIRIILIDDLNDLHLPMLDLVVDKMVVDVSDWSSHLRVETSPSVYINYFNVRNSHWEPFIEPWQFYLTASRQSDSGTTSVDFYSRRKLEVTLSHVFIETMLRTQDVWSKQPQRNVRARRGVHAPYVIRNRTGYSMHLWADAVGDGLDTELKQLADNEEMPWRFDDWRTMRERTLPAPNKVSIQLHGPSWETLKGVLVDREGTQFYVLRPAINRVVHRLVCDVKLVENVKVVTFRSATVIQNSTPITIHAMAVNAKRQMTCGIYTIAPGEERPIPIESSYYDSIQIRPQEGFGYTWSAEVLSWRDLQKESVALITCNSYDPSVPPFRFQVNCEYHKEAATTAYPMLTMKLLPPFQVENLLPYDFRYVIVDRTTRQEHRDVVKQGALNPVFTINPLHLLAMSIEVLGTEYKPSDVAIITNSDLEYRDDTLTLTDAEGRPLQLKIKYSDRLALGGRKVSIYSPYVLMNKTGLDMFFSARSLLATSRFAAGQGVKRSKKTDIVEPFMFSYSNFEPLRSRAQVKVEDSDWSKPISFEAVGSSYDVAIPSATRGLEYRMGVTVTEGEGKFYLTKVVTFAPRFILKNNMDEDLQFRQQRASAAVLLKSKDSGPLHTIRSVDEGFAQLSVRLTGLTNEWSNPINITEVGRIYVKLGRMSSPEEDLVRVEVHIENATIFVVFVRREKIWPFKIINDTDTDVTIWQQKIIAQYFGQNSQNRYKIPGTETRPYAWDDPSYRGKVMVISVNGREREIDALEIGQLVPLKYPLPGTNKYGVMAIQVFAQGPTLCIKLSPYVESRSAFRRTTVGRSDTVKSDLDGNQGAFEMKRKEASLLMAFQLRLEGIGVSIVNAQPQELLYASAKNVMLAWTDTTTDQALSFSIKWLQIDNQLYGCLEPIFVYPTVLPKEGDEEIHPVLMATLSKSKDTSFGVEYYEWFTILLQELSVDMDEDFLYALVNFTKFNVPGWNDAEHKLCDTTMAIPEPPLTDDSARMYFEKFLLQPVQFNISFVRTQAANAEEDRHRRRGFFSFVLDVMTMTIGNIHDAPIRLNALELQHPYVTPSQLADLIVKFYTQETVSQLHKVIGSADVLGNPVGLFNNVSSGVSDFFYEPLQGFEITRPQDFGIGVAKGTASLFKKTVFGVSDTFSKVTGSIGKGLSVITMDEQFQERRRLASARNRPRHAVYGVTTGATSLARSVASGITGVVSKPLEGAQEEGVGGFFKGIGKGLVG